MQTALLVHLLCHALSRLIDMMGHDMTFRFLTILIRFNILGHPDYEF